MKSPQPFWEIISQGWGKMKLALNHAAIWILKGTVSRSVKWYVTFTSMRIKSNYLVAGWVGGNKLNFKGIEMDSWQNSDHFTFLKFENQTNSSKVRFYLILILIWYKYHFILQNLKWWLKNTIAKIVKNCQITVKKC